MDADERDDVSTEDDALDRTSYLEEPGWRRRTERIVVEAAGPGRLEATVTSRLFAPGALVRRAVEVVPGTWLERALRRVAGREVRLRIVFRQGTIRLPTALVVGEEEIQPGEVEAVALQGWQERFGAPQIWDVTLVGPNRDLVVGHPSQEEAMDLAAKVAAVLGVPLREPALEPTTFRGPKAREMRRPGALGTITWLRR